jgi:subtilase family serine protease
VIRVRTVSAFLFAALLVPAAVATTASADPGGVPNANAADGQSHKPVCLNTGQAGLAHCHAEIVTDAQGNPLVTSGPAGYGPTDLRNAYNLTATGSGTVAIVDAYDDPTAEQDLNTYRHQFGITPDCTTANGCFGKVNQTGGTTYPRADSGWAQEISLDLDVVSAICPGCKIILVETNSAYLSDLGAGVNEAAALGANAISNSYGGNEFSSETSYENSYYNHPGIAVTASSGDSGYGVEFPAASQYVTAVGGTTLSPAPNARGWTETAWSGAGSGCSAYEPKPAAQPYVGCGTSTSPRRMVADVSAVANPNTGVAVYDNGWLVFGGTSVASPLIAATYVLSGNATSYSNAYPYSHTAFLNDVVSGTNGRCRRVPALFCTAGPGYDGPTGLGTPNGTGAF